MTSAIWVSELKLKNFRSIGDHSITYSPCPGLNVIIGPNNSGKSSILDAIVVAARALFQEFPQSDYWKHRERPAIELRLSFDPPSSEAVSGSFLRHEINIALQHNLNIPYDRIEALSSLWPDAKIALGPDEGPGFHTVVEIGGKSVDENVIRNPEGNQVIEAYGVLFGNQLPAVADQLQASSVRLGQGLSALISDILKTRILRFADVRSHPAGDHPVQRQGICEEFAGDGVGDHGLPHRLDYAVGDPRDQHVYERMPPQERAAGRFRIQIGGDYQDCEENGRHRHRGLSDHDQFAPVHPIGQNPRPWAD